MHITYRWCSTKGDTASHCITTLYPRYNLIQLCTVTSMPTLLQFQWNRIGTSIKMWN